MAFYSYSDLLGLVQALAGVDAFTPSEQANILAFANRRIYEAYNASPLWPRYIVTAQARPAVDGVIAHAYDEVAGVRSVSSASRSGTTVTVVCTSNVSFVTGMRVTVAGLTGSEDPNGTYQVASVDDATFTYELEDGTGTETYGGTGTVSPLAVPVIDHFHRIWACDPFRRYSATEFEFNVDSDGAHIINNYNGLSGFWVGFKKEWDGPYTANSTNIPSEFYYFAAHAAYADFLRMDAQVDKAFAEEANAKQYLTIEMEKASMQKNLNNAYRRISTHNSRQAR